MKTIPNLLEDVRDILARCLKAIDAMHANDDVVRELVRTGLSEELAKCSNLVYDILDATSCYGTAWRSLEKLTQPVDH